MMTYSNIILTNLIPTILITVFEYFFCDWLLRTTLCQTNKELLKVQEKPLD